jgi:flagellar assembly factor FliW
MQIDTLRFGTVEVDEEKVIEFGDGIPGLEQYRKYALLQFEESYPIVWLQSMDDTGICLPVLDTFSVLSDYVFDIDESDVKLLELNAPDELHVVSVVVIPEDIQGMTVNLAAPIIINIVTGKAKQIVLSGSEYNVRVPVFQQICNTVARGEGNDDAGTV